MERKKRIGAIPKPVALKRAVFKGQTPKGNRFPFIAQAAVLQYIRRILFYYPEDGGSTFLRNLITYLPNYMAEPSGLE
jgi:hypothetical protein